MFFLSLQGSWYDIGFQHGEKLRSLIQIAIQKRCRFFKKNQRPNQTELTEKAKRLKKEFPELLEEMKGIADGAECSLEDMLIYNLSPFIESCSNLAFLCDEEPMLGHLNDDVSKGEFDVAFHIHLSDGREILHIGLAGSAGTAAAINSDGLAISHACARSGGLKNAEAILNLSLFRRVLIEQSHNCQEAETFLSTHSLTSGADNIIAIDKMGASFVAEKLPTTVEFRYPEKGAIYCTGRALTPKIRHIVNQDIYEKKDPKVKTLIKREQYFENSISKHHGDYSVELMKKVLCCTDEGIKVCNELSNWASILLPYRFEMLVAYRFPCSNAFVRFGKD